MGVTIADVIEIMESIAPSGLAEDWDNVGLQVGRKDWQVNKIRVALDPLPAVVSEACQANADMLITHHPLLFTHLKSVDFTSPSGQIIYMAARNHLGIFSAHTNLDSVSGGINDILVAKLGLRSMGILGKAILPARAKLVFYVPAEYENNMLDALFETSAGQIGEYSCCSFRSKGTGTYMPGASATPFEGKAGEISHAEEIRMETVVCRKNVPKIVNHIRKIHPYETMAYDVYPVENYDDSINAEGLGRIGILEKELTLRELALKVKSDLGLSNVRFAGDPELPVKKAAICSGSGSGLIKRFFSSGAQAYLTGDLGYHNARDAENAGLGLIDLGHFGSEHIIAEVLSERLREIFSKNGMDVRVETSRVEKEPFIYL